jgi:hypothetical protein
MNLSVSRLSTQCQVITHGGNAGGWALPLCRFLRDAMRFLC